MLAYTDWHDNLISYRLFTIWAVFQVLTTLVIIGLLIDRWHDATDRWPVRQTAILMLPLAVWLFSRSHPVTTSELNRHLTHDQIQVWEGMRSFKSQENPRTVDWHGRKNREWFDHLNSRVAQAPESQPVVIVAASGGGSRAAIFTALVLETLARTPIAPSSSISNSSEAMHERTWADNIVLISSVSGGSLASAYHVGRLEPQASPEVAGESPQSQILVLHNTPPGELRTGSEIHAGSCLAYLDDPQPPFRLRNR